MAVLPALIALQISRTSSSDRHSSINNLHRFPCRVYVLQPQILGMVLVVVHNLKDSDSASGHNASAFPYQQVDWTTLGCCFRNSTVTRIIMCSTQPYLLIIFRSRKVQYYCQWCIVLIVYTLALLWGLTHCDRSLQHQKIQAYSIKPGGLLEVHLRHWLYILEV